MIKPISISWVMLCALALLASCLALPSLASAAKPDVTGQDRAAQVQEEKGGKSRANASESASTEDEAEGESEDEASDDEEDDGEGEGTGKARGLERAAQAGNKPERIRNQLTYIQMLIEQMKSAMNGGGIGKELSEYIANGRQLPDDGTGDDGGDDTGNDVTQVALVSLLSAAETVVENDASTTADNVAEFVLDVEVTASGTDAIIPDGIDTTATATVGIVFGIENASGTVVMTGTTTALLESTATATGTTDFIVGEGETETFTVSVSFDPAEEGDYRLQLEKIQINGEFYDLTPAADFQSDLVSV